MKAIHNITHEHKDHCKVVWDQSYIIIESNSQPHYQGYYLSIVVWDQSYIIIESNSQQSIQYYIISFRCVGSKLHNNWKQFTTDAG